MKKEEIVEILDKHLKTLIEGKEDEWFKFEEMKTMPEYNTVLNAMLEVAEKAVNENCNLQNVSNNEVAVCWNCERHKLLLKKPAYCKYCGDRLIT